MEDELEPHDTKAVDVKEEVSSAPEDSSPQQEKSSNNGQFKSVAADIMRAESDGCGFMELCRIVCSLCSLHVSFSQLKSQMWVLAPPV